MKPIRMLLTILAVATIFITGIWIGTATTDAVPANWESDPSLLEEVNAFNPFAPVTPRASPVDRIPEQAIAVYHDRIVLDIQDAQWATFTDTHSMEPVIMAGANAIELVPKSEADIQVGDIVSYRSNYADGTIIHRVVYRGTDELGTYFIMKGDNLATSDPGRIRFDQIERVVVAIVY